MLHAGRHACTLSSCAIFRGLLQRRQQTPRHGPRLLRQDCIHQHQRRHALDNGYGAGHHARIVAALGRQHAFA